MRLYIVCIVAATVWLSGPRPRALAQEATDDSPPSEVGDSPEVREARALFVAGAEAVEGGRWADALERFGRAYELSRVPAALYNVAFALRALGRHVEARDAFEQLLERHEKELKPDMLASSRDFLAEAKRRVAQLLLLGLSADLSYEVRLDGARQADSRERPLILDVDPGRHALSVAARGRRTFVWEGRLGDGERLTLEVSLPPTLDQPTTGPAGTTTHADLPEEIDEEEGSVFTNPFFWTLVGIVVIGVGAAVGYFILQNDAQLTPMSDKRFKI